MKLVAALAALTLCATTADARVVYTRTTAPPGWTKGARASAADAFTFRVALNVQNLARLESAFWAVSTPGSKSYGAYMEPQEIVDMIKPTQADHDKVVAFYGGAQAKVTSHKDSLVVETTVERAEQLLATQLFAFEHSKTGRVVTRQWGAYSVDDSVDALVHFITGVADFPMPRPEPKHARPGPLGQVQADVSPETLRKFYSIPASAKGAAASSQAVIEYQNDTSFSFSDLKTFYNDTATHTDNITAPHIIGPFSPGDPDVEATLDYQYMSAVGVDNENWYWTESEWLYDWGVKFFNTKDVPMVNSMSWGWSESAQCDIGGQECSVLGIDSQQYVQRVNVEYQKIGLRGITLLVASGDSGANGRTDYECTDSVLHPDFPAGSPYVTTVGATQVNPATQKTGGSSWVCQDRLGGNTCVVGGEEDAVSFNVAGFASGGGFANFSPQPSYQTAAVAGYLKQTSKLPPATYFNATGRGYPDVAALGNNYLIEIDSGFTTVGGTSCAAPAWAGLVALLNADRLAAGGKPLGFLNPLLYKMWADEPTTFQDVTAGDNKCTEAGCASTCQGYSATKGWDAVTGLGTPNYTNMLAYIQKMDAGN